MHRPLSVEELLANDGAHRMLPDWGPRPMSSAGAIGPFFVAAWVASGMLFRHASFAPSPSR